MHAQTSASAPCARTPGFVHFKSQERRENRLRYRAQVASLCDLLANADLSATAMRLALNTLARLIRRGSTTEAMPVAAIAEQLGVHRNAVSAGYGALEAAGIVKRVAVKHRGAPTRTRLVGIAAELVQGKTPDITETGKAVSLEMVVPENDAPVSHANSATENAIPVFDARRDELPDAASPRIEASGVAPGKPGTTPPVEDNSPRKGRGDGAAPAGGFVFDKAINDSMLAKVPADARMAAMLARRIGDVRVDLAWGLSDREVEHFRALVPKPERAAVVRPKLAAEKLKPLAGRELTEALSHVLPRLEIAAGSTAQAFAVADQIAYSVIAKGLGQGNVLAGVRAAVKMVETKRWGEPRGYASERDHWSGIAMRSLISATPGTEGHAQKSVH